jgi:hypothetical protein
MVLEYTNSQKHLETSSKCSCLMDSMNCMFARFLQNKQTYHESSFIIHHFSRFFEVAICCDMGDKSTSTNTRARHG